MSRPVGTIIIEGPTVSRTTFTWTPFGSETAMRKAANAAIPLAKRRARKALKSATGALGGRAFLGVLAQYAIQGLLQPTPEAWRLTCASLAALYLETGVADWRFELNEHGQVIRMFDL